MNKERDCSKKVLLKRASAGADCVEKTIGCYRERASVLNVILTANFEESQIFHIDYFLGKETMLNILAFPFAKSVPTIKGCKKCVFFKTLSN